jgi:hypothetical protein
MNVKKYLVVLFLDVPINTRQRLVFEMADSAVNHVRVTTLVSGFSDVLYQAPGNDTSTIYTYFFYENCSELKQMKSNDKFLAKNIPRCGKLFAAEVTPVILLGYNCRRCCTTLLRLKEQTRLSNRTKKFLKTCTHNLLLETRPYGFTAIRNSFFSCSTTGQCCRADRFCYT